MPELESFLKNHQLYSMPRNNRQRSRRRSDTRRAVQNYIPPSLPTPFRGSCVLRYQLTGSAGSVHAIPWKAFCNLLGVATSTTAVRSIFSAIRVKELHLRSPAIVQTSATSFVQQPITLRVTSPYMDVGAQTSAFDTSRVMTDVATNTRGAYCCFKCPKNSPYRAWLDVLTVDGVAASPTFVQITCPLGSVLDVHISYQLYFQQSATMVPLSATGVTTGAMYQNFLDSVTSAGSAGAGVWVNVSSTGNVSSLFY